MNKFILTIAGTFCLINVNGQVVESYGFDSSYSNERVNSEILNQASLGFSGSAPRITLKTYKLSALIGNGSLDFYLYNSIPTLATNPGDTLEIFANEILSQVGGIANLCLGKTFYFANGADQLNKDIKGAQFEIRTGAKMIDSQSRFTDPDKTDLVPFLQSSLDVRYVIPLVPAQRSKVRREDIKRLFVGLMGFRVYATYSRPLKGEVYDLYFADERGNLPLHDILAFNAEFNIFITNELYLSLGYSKCNETSIPQRTFFSISYNGQ